MSELYHYNLGEKNPSDQYALPEQQTTDVFETVGGNTLVSKGNLQSPNYVPTKQGYTLNNDGSAEFRDIIATGNITATSITATAGTVGGFDIGTDYVRDAANSFGLAATVTGGDDVRFWAGDTFANRATADFRITEAGAVTATNIVATGTINAIGGYLGAPTTVLNISTSGLDIGTTGHIQGGQSAFNTGTGFFLGYEGAAYKFSIGNPAGNYITWDGTTLVIVGNQVVTDVYTTSGGSTWTKPTGAKTVDVYVFGAGGGGGSGSRSAGTPNNRQGGAGGGGGAFAFKSFVASVLGTTETVTVGAKGAGGAAVSADGVGNDGTAGTSSSFGTAVLLQCGGGQGGQGGQNGAGATGGVGGIAGNGLVSQAGGDGKNSTFNTDGSNATGTDVLLSSRGGGPGAPATGASNYTGGNGGGFITNYVKAGGAKGSIPNGNGAGGAATSTSLLYGGVGGGGGSSDNASTTPGSGGVGGNYGGGGGGGGGAAAGTSGAGGNGADGLVVVISYL